MKRHLFYDNTRISDYRTCPRRFYFRHVRHWVPDATAVALIFGSAWHAAMDVLWVAMTAHKGMKLTVKDIVSMSYDAFVLKWIQEGAPHPSEMDADDIEEFQPRTPMIAKEMLHGYLTARSNFFQRIELIDVERPFAVPLDAGDDTRQYVGRLDKSFTDEGRFRLAEHKTTTAYKINGYFRNDFLDSFTPNSQIDGYQFAANLLYDRPLDSIHVDAALVHKSVHDGFKFIPVDRMESQLDAWLWETHVWIDQIEANKAALADEGRTNTPYMAAFPKNTSSCGSYGGCPYRDICKAVANPHKLRKVPLGYKVSPWSPFNEIALEKIGFSREQDQP